MSKINANRFINITYDKNIIYDETFNYKSLNSLLSLANGGGKSVLVQLSCAPYLRPSKRNFNNRLFSDFFHKGNAPSVILTEWSLDGNNGYVLVGMIVKKVKSEFDDEDELNVTTFIHEYTNTNSFDINNIPLVKKDGEKITVLDYKSMLNTLTKCKEHKIDVFELTNDSVVKRYFRKLSEYGIYEKEWLSIIKQINADESGLAKFFDKESTVQSLLVKRFLPAVNEKLNDDVDNIAGFREDILQYVEIMAQNEEKLDFKDAVNSFNESSKDVLHTAKEIEKIRKNLQDNQINLLMLRKFLSKTVSGLQIENEDYKALIDDSNKKILEVDYDKLSKDYYSILGKKTFKEDELRELNISKVQLENKKLEVEKELAIQQALSEKNEITSIENENFEYHEHIKNAQRSDKEKETELKNVTYSLKYSYEDVVQSLSTDIFDLEKEISLSSSEKDKLSKKIQSLRADKDIKVKEKGALDSMITSFNKMEKDFLSKYTDFDIVKNIMNLYRENELIAYKEKIEEEINSLNKKLETNNSSIEDNEYEINTLYEDIQELREENVSFNETLKNINRSLEEYFTKKQKLISDLNTVGISVEDVFNKNKNISLINNMIQHKEEEKYILKTSLNRLIKEKTMYMSGENIELPQEFIKALSKQGIDITYGYEWLKKQSHLSYEEKCDYVKRNPLLPYSILLNSTDYDNLIKANIDIFVEFPVPILRKDYIVKDNSIEVLNGILKNDAYSLYVAFNNVLLDEEKLKSILDGINREIREIEQQLSYMDSDINIFKNALMRVSSFDYDSDYENSLKSKEREFQNKIDLNTEEICSKDEMRSSLQILNKNMIDENTTITSSLHYCDIKLKDINAFIIENKNYEDNIYNLKLIEDCIVEIEDNLTLYTIKIDEIFIKINELKDILSDKKRTEKEYLERLIKLGDCEKGEIVEGSIVELETKLNSLNSEIGFEVSLFKNKIEENNKKLNIRQKAYQQILENKKISEADLNDKIYDIEYIANLNIEEKNLNVNINDVINKTMQVSGQVDVLADRLLNKEKDCIKISTKLEYSPGVKNKADIGEYSFSERKAQLSKDIDFANNAMKENDKSISKYSGIIDKLEFYVQDIEMPDVLDKDYKFSIETVIAKKEELVKNINWLKTSIEQHQNILGDRCVDIDRHFKFKNIPLFDNAIRNMLREDVKKNEKDMIHLIEATCISSEKLLQKYIKDLDDIRHEENTIVSNIYEYALFLHKEIGDIDKNSRITIGGKSYKMLKIEQPEKERILELSARDFLSSIASQCMSAFKNGKSGEEVLKVGVTTTTIYDALIGLGNVNITIMKIRENSVEPLPWSAVCKNSGGEGFVSSFIIVSSLLSYMRKNPEDIRLKETGKVLIMDNPFGKTSSKHLLIPMMEIAKKYNTQLICLSDLGKSDIYDRFDRIFALRLLESSLDKDKKILRIIDNHDVNEYDNIMTSSKFETERYTQEMLF